MIKSICATAAAMAVGAGLTHAASADQGGATGLPTPAQAAPEVWEGDPLAAPDLVLQVCRFGPERQGNFGWAQSDGLIGEGWNAVDEQRGEDAVLDFMAAIHVGPLRPEPYWGLGVAAHVAGFGDVVIDACFARAIAMIPDVAAVRAELGDVLALRQRWDEAIAAYEAALALDDGFMFAHDRLSAALLAIGDMEGAIEHHERAEALRAGE